MNVAVISISLPDDLRDDMDAAIERGEYRGRSEFMRAAIRELLRAKHTQPSAHMHGSITLAYPHEHTAKISDARHAFHDVVLSMMHTHCEPEVCMDVLIVGGDTARIEQLQESLARMREVRQSHLALIG